MRHQRNPCSYMSSTTVTVERSGPPCVITYGSAKIWNCPIIVITPTNRKVGPRAGSVTCQNRARAPAPSSSAASCSSSGIACRPAMKMSML